MISIFKPAAALYAQARKKERPVIRLTEEQKKNFQPKPAAWRETHWWINSEVIYSKPLNK
jgi:hypothetical protein